MIRDDFKDVKRVTSKEARKKQSMGERNFYATGISKLRDLNKAVTFSVKFTSVLMSAAYALILLSFIFAQIDSKFKYKTSTFIIWSCIYGAILVFTLLWFTVIRPNNEKKAERYKAELERLSARDVGKIAAAYKIYGEQYKKEITEKHREDSERARAAAEASKAETEPPVTESSETEPSAADNDETV